MFIYRHKATCERPVIDDGGFFTYVWGVHNQCNWYIHVHVCYMYLGYVWLVLTILYLLIPTVLHAKMMDLPVSSKLILKAC